MRRIIVIVILISLIISGCKREYGSFYDPPEGQKGQIYNQLVSDPRFSVFVSAIDKVPGLKNELSSSGLFTIMAPDDEAFRKFFENHPTFKSLDVIPADTLNLMIKYHIMKWMLFQIDFLKPGLTKDNFKAYKYETRANLVLTEHALAGGTMAIYYPSKMLQVYTPNFFSLFNVTAQDYTSLYGAGSSIAVESKMNVMAATVTKQDIASGNGVIHVIDEVLQPPATIAQILDNNPEYSEFSKLLKRRFLTYTFNKSATVAQGNNGDINGDGLVDSLWTRNYAINSYIDDENPLTSDTKTPFSITGFAPPGTAFISYLNNKLSLGFSNNVDSIPNRTLSLFYQSYFANNMYWPSQIDAGNATNLLNDKIILSRDDINEATMASNGIFYKLNKVIEPDAFRAVTGPIFLSSDYWYFAEMIIQSGMLSSLAKANAKYTVLCPTNEAFKNYGIYYDAAPGGSFKPGFFLKVGINVKQLTIPMLLALVGNHIIPDRVLPVSGLTNGFYLTQNNSIIAIEGGKIHGSVRDTIPQITDPDKLMVNGYFHGINKTIIDPQQSIYDIINSASLYNAVPPLVRPEFMKFRELCIAAGILTKDFGTITQVDADKKFTLFVPSNDVITAAQVAGILPKTGALAPIPPVVLTTAQKARLESYISYFFVRDKLSLTDGKVTGTFNTSKKDPKYTPTDPVFIPSLITYPGSILTFNDIGTSTTGKVVMTNQILYPQNTIAKDGIIHIIDNAFTLKY